MMSILRSISMYVVILGIMLLLSMGVLAAEQQNTVKSSSETQVSPSGTAVQSLTPSVWPSAENQPVTTPTPTAESSPLSSVLDESPAQQMVQPALSTEESSVMTQGDSTSDFTTTDVEGGVEITKYTGNATNLVIPATIGGKKVISVGRYVAMRGYDIQSVTFNEGIVEIKTDAFANCYNLEAVTLSSTITTIGDNAFFNGAGRISKVSVPNEVTSIGTNAFGKGIWIYGSGGSAAETYAKDDGCAFISNTTVKSGGYYYKTNAELKDENNQIIDGIIIVAFDGKESTSAIEKLDGKTVVGIGPAAFRGNTTLTSLTLGDAVQDVGVYAFMGCTALTTANVGKGMCSISIDAFRDCTALTCVQFSEGLNAINESAFRGCKSLKAIDLPSSLTFIGASSFANCEAVSEIIIPDSVTTIEESAFRDCTLLEKVTIGRGLELLQNEVFGNDTNLRHIDIPNNVTTINDSALGVDDGRCDAALLYGETGSQAETFAKINGFVFIGGNSKQSGDFYYEEVTGGIKIIAYTGKGVSLTLDRIEGKDIVAIGDGVFANQDQLRSVVLGSGVQSIGVKAFKKSGLKTISMDKGLETIGESAFKDCEGLSAVTLNDGLTTIGAKAFYGSRVGEIIIPDSVTEMGNDAFSWCLYLKSVEIGAGLQCLGGFSHCKSLKTVAFSSNSTVSSINTYGFIDCFSLENIVLPSGLKSIGDNAFYDCFELKEIEIPEGVTSIGDNAFSWCITLKKVIIPASVVIQTAQGGGISFFQSDNKVVIYGNSGSVAETIANNCKLPFVSERTLFSNGYYYEYVTNGVKIIKADNPLKTTLPSTLGGKSVVEIGNCAFYGDLSLKFADCSVIKTIGTYAFAACSNLTIFGEKDSIAQTYALANNIRFISNDSLNENGYYYEEVEGGVKITATVNPGKVNVPEKLGGKPVVEIGDYAFANDQDLTKVDSPNLKVIGKGAFSGCDNLTNIVLATGVTKIKPYALSNCSGLKKISLPSGLAEIGPYAFEDCSSLTEIIFPMGLTTIGSKAINGCTALKKVTVSDSGTQIEEGALSGDFFIYGVKGSTAENYAAANNLRFITSATPESNGYYYENVEGGVEITASDCLENIVVPNVLDSKKVVAIGNYAFANDTVITDANLGSNIQSVGEKAFINCINLKNAKFSNNIVSLGANAFYRCTSLFNVTLGTGISKIEKGTFWGCDSLDSIILPKSIKTVESYSFYCENLKTVFVPNSATNVTICENAIYAANLEKAYLPMGVSSVGNHAFYTSFVGKGYSLYLNPENLTIYGASGTAAEAYADNNAISFKADAYTLGDVNNDGNINASDALQDLRHSVSEIQLTGTVFSAGDVTKDDTINAADALQILRYSVSEIKSF